MTTHNQLWSSLQATFIEDLKTTRQLRDILKRERNSLEVRNYDAFQQIVSEKSPLLEALQRHSHTRQQLLQAAGFKDEPATLQVAKQQAPIVAKAWHHLAEQWANCQEMSAINEGIVQRTRLVVNQTLDMLRGKSEQNNLYSQSGSTTSTAPGRSITSA